VVGDRWGKFVCFIEVAPPNVAHDTNGNCTL
jgi:hypothetical protein